MGVYSPELTEKMAHVLKKLGAREAFVVCGEGTLDEISICEPTKMSHLKDGEIISFEMAPKDFGLKTAKPEDIKGGNVEDNAQIIKDVLNGQRDPKRDMGSLECISRFCGHGFGPVL